MTFSFKRFMFTCVCFAGFAFADDNPTGEFYSKDQVKAFFSVKAQYEQLSGSAINAINHLAFGYGWGWYSIFKDTAGVTDTVFTVDRRLLHFNQFGNSLMGLGLEFGGQYHQFTTWLDASFMPTQISPVPAAYKTQQMMDVSWYRYGFDLMVGYQLAPENSPINLIPSIGGGINVFNVHLADQYDVYYPDAADPVMKTYSLGRKYYSNFGKDVNTQLELRLNLGGGLSLGAYAGYKFVWYDEMLLEYSSSQRYIVNYSEPGGDAWYLGGKVTYTLPSVFETKQKEKF